MIIILLGGVCEPMSATDLVNYLEERAGEYHRGTVRYDQTDTDVLHLRDDVREERMLSEINRMLQRLRPEATMQEEQAFPFGELHATVRVFEDALVLHFPISSKHGVVVSLEPETARNLNTFLGECEKRIHG